MEEDNNSSWIRRAKFSHTVCHRLDASRLNSKTKAVPSSQNGAEMKRAVSSLLFASSLPSGNMTLRKFDSFPGSKEDALKPKESGRAQSPLPRARPIGSRSLVLDTQVSDFSFMDVRNSESKKGDQNPPPTPSLGPGRLSLDVQKVNLVSKPEVKNLKSKPVAQAAPPSTVPDSRMSASVAKRDDKGWKPSRRDSSPLPSKYVGSKKVSFVDRREEKKNKSKRRSLSPLPSLTFSQTFKEARSLSPLPCLTLSQTFKEARSEAKRFSTPISRRKEKDGGLIAKLLSKEVNNRRAVASPISPRINLFQYSSPSRSRDKVKGRKETAWARYFDPTAGRVSAVDAAEEWRVDLSELYLGLRFAIGAHSRLYHGIYKSEAVAVKIITLPDDDDDNDDDGVLAARLEKQFIGEVTLLSHLYHRNVIKLVGASRTPPALCIITEYLSGGSLRSFLHKPEHKALPLPKLISIALGIARGMEYIHSQGVIHRDLKPENIIFDQDFCVKIADFGIACEEAYCDMLADDPGTYRFMAPEMIKHKTYGRKVDVYSFGLVMWEMLTGRIPYEDMIPYQAAFAVVDKNLRPTISSECPPPLRALIEQCWTLHPEKRPEFWQIVKVLEQFESALAQDGTINSVQSLTTQDHYKRLHSWIQKLKPSHSESSFQSMPKLL